MPLTPSNVTRTDDLTGDSFLTFTTGGGARAQGVVICDTNGDHAGIAGTPVVVSVEGTVTTTISGTPDVNVVNTADVNIASQAAALQIDDSTPIDVNIASPNPLPVSFSSGTINTYETGASAEASAQIHNAAADLKELRVILDPSVASIRYLMLFDAASLPINGTAPLWRGLIPPAGEMSETWADGLPFATGIIAAVSSSADTLTVVPTGEAYFHALRV